MNNDYNDDPQNEDKKYKNRILTIVMYGVLGLFIIALVSLGIMLFVNYIRTGYWSFNIFNN